MLEKIETLFKKQNILSHKNQGITVASVSGPKAGVDLAKTILYSVVDKKTVLYLSGGSTPKTLYTQIAEEEILKAGAIAQVDERFGEPMHLNSNQKMIFETGLSTYAKYTSIPVYWMLQAGKSRQEAAELYDQKVRELNSVYSKSVAILGVGADGHTSGIPAQNFIRQSGGSNFKLDNHKLVTDYNDETGKYGERVTTTFLGLEMYDMMILLVFGGDKKEALGKMFEDGPEEEIPARFFKRPEIAKKTLLITDQTV